MSGSISMTKRTVQEDYAEILESIDPRTLQSIAICAIDKDGVHQIHMLGNLEELCAALQYVLKDFTIITAQPASDAIN